MSILFALALAATPAAQPASAAVVDQAEHAQHQKHMKQCHDMMAKMHQGMKHDGHAQHDDTKPSGQKGQ